MPNTNAASRRKRQYQPSSQQTLDAFLARHTIQQPHPPNLFPSSSAPEPSRSPSSEGFPAQPPHVQSSLLQVGLRVRKSVPEGYKTHKTIGDGIWLDDTNSATSSDELGTRPSASAPPAAPMRELQPYCGIHRVGGYGVQASSSSSPVPSLTFSSSQGSRVSSVNGRSAKGVADWDGGAATGNARKRAADYDDELLEEAFGADDSDVEEEDSDEEAAGLTFKNVAPEMRRKMPMSRDRSQFAAGLRNKQQVARRLGGDGRAESGGVMVVDDFPEAEFLRPAEDMDTGE
ncbi:MAG: hypothetical protein M1821_009961 [Bathelium mastoideum]|nr:MAG: hypothetical protein M1821_009961 [Bathelium mastoideum]